MPNNKRIAIIGGGVTGLVTAYELSKKNYEITIYEQGSTLGGLLSGTTIENHPIERAYHHAFTTDEYTIQLTSELGLSNDLVWYPGSNAIHFNNRKYPFNGALDLLKFTPLSFFDRIRTGIVILYLSYTRSWKKLSSKTAADWLKKWSGMDAYRIIWRPLLQGKFHDYYKDVSMAWFWARIHTRANSRGKSEELGYFKSGFSTLIDSLVKSLTERNVIIKTSTPVNKITSTPSGFSITCGALIEHFDYVVCTIPTSVFARLTTGINALSDYTNQLHSITYLDAVCLIFSTPQKLSNYYWTSIHDTNIPFVVCINHTQFVPTSWFGNRQVYYLANYFPQNHPILGTSDKTLRDQWFNHLLEIYPQFDRSVVREITVTRLKNAQHIPFPSYENIVPTYATPVKNLYLSHFSQIFPEDRGVNFAIREGLKIAKTISESE
ncbi:NAD(P)/FAD-dependent oxidoreductase [Candidatus Dojkabacteria bacterium]|uniref:NAD(P)/FAD-dependent oxidoreductase n=1 Tax=Candidatus Dojkabacteria bacterium TaxID=2099670 RepID=A0A955L7A5_9BACT|nr:NAD(P)/FAD-dependent oxidoreductase [Candidatus Dojkabacteria bacterium]